MPTRTVYISIGNSDDKLTQKDWAMFQIDVHKLLQQFGVRMHGEWHSHDSSFWQNACWCVEVMPGLIGRLKLELAELAGEYRQDSIAWAETPQTEFLGTAGA